MQKYNFIFAFKNPLKMFQKMEKLRSFSIFLLLLLLLLKYYNTQSIKVFLYIRMLSVAHGLVYVLRCAQNGSIWISEDGKPVYEIQLFDSLPQKNDDSILDENESELQIN